MAFKMKGPSLYKNSPLRSETRPLTDDEKKKLKGNVGTVQGTVVDIAKNIPVGDATIKSKKKEATGFTGRKV